MEMKINFSKKKKSKIGDYLSQWFGKDFIEKEEFIVDPRIAFMVNDILKEAAVRGTGGENPTIGKKGFCWKNRYLKRRGKYLVYRF